MPSIHNLARSAWKLAPTGLKPFLLRTRNNLRNAVSSIEALYLEPARLRRRAKAMPKAGARRRVTLFLAPEAALEPFFASHALLARVLQDAGEEAILLSCDGMQPICSAKIAHQIGPTSPGAVNESLCVRCRAVMRKTGFQYALADIPIEDLLTPHMRAEIEAIVATNSHTPWKTEIEGIQIGRACLGETLRKQRKLSIDELSPEDIRIVNALLYSGLAVYFSVKVLAEKFDIARIAYFGDYAYFIAPQILAKRLGIPLTNVSHAYNRDIDRRYLNLRPGNGFINMLAQVDAWPHHRHTPIPPKRVEQIGDGGLYRLHGFGGASTYSPNWSQTSENLREVLGLPPGGRILVAYSNSTDELLCNRELLAVMGVPYYDNTPNPFSSQLEWLTALANWVGQRDDLRLIIRLHPRMAKGHRHAAESSEAAQMREALASLPPNVAVVWPESKVSSYNIAEHAAVALSAWSSIALELARFGVPTVSAFQRVGPWPNANFHMFADTREGYFKTIEKALDQRPNLISITEAYRWTHYLHWAPLIDVSDVIPEPDYSGVPRFQPPRNRDTILAVMVGGVDLQELNMSKLSHSEEAVRSERAELLTSLGKVLVYFLSGISDSQHTGYRIEERGQVTTVGMPSDGCPVFRITVTDEISLTMAEGDFHRHSPLAARLARSVANGWSNA